MNRTYVKKNGEVSHYNFTRVYLPPGELSDFIELDRNQLGMTKREYVQFLIELRMNAKKKAPNT